MIDWIREKVAHDKNRTVWKDQYLDLTYITDRVIAMAFPASGIQKAYRNSIDDVSDFLNERHGSHYLVINLSTRNYDYTKFENRVKSFFWPDHKAPPLSTIFDACAQMFNFLCSHPENVVVAHCNHGKGRTGTSIIAFLLFVGLFKNTEKALEFYNKARFSNEGLAVDQPCQLRYINYVATLLKDQHPRRNQVAMKLVRIKQSGLDPAKMFLRIVAARTQTIKHDSLSLTQGAYFDSIPLMSDLFIEVMDVGWMTPSQVARINMNIYFTQPIADGMFRIRFESSDIKVSQKGLNFWFQLIFKPFCQCHQRHPINEEHDDQRSQQPAPQYMQQQQPMCQCSLERRIETLHWERTLQNCKRVRDQNKINANLSQELVNFKGGNCS